MNYDKKKKSLAEKGPTMASIKKANKLFFNKKTKGFFGDQSYHHDTKAGTFHVKHSHGGHTYKVNPKTHELEP